MARGRALLTVICLSLWAGGCRHETPIERGVREYHEKLKVRIALADLETTRFRRLTDVQRVNINRKDGLGFGVQVEKTELHIGESLKLHLAYENIAANSPISATTCTGFNIGVEDTVTGETTAVPITFACDQDDPFREHNVELPKGELKIADMTVDKTQFSFDHAGQYIMVAGWQSFHPREGLFQRGDDYSVMPSNQLLITVR